MKFNKSMLKVNNNSVYLNTIKRRSFRFMRKI